MSYHVHYMSYYNVCVFEFDFPLLYFCTLHKDKDISSCGTLYFMQLHLSLCTQSLLNNLIRVKMVK